MPICCFVYGAGKIHDWLRTVDTELSPVLDTVERCWAFEQRGQVVVCNVRATKTSNTFLFRFLVECSVLYGSVVALWNYVQIVHFFTLIGNYYVQFFYVKFSMC